MAKKPGQGRSQGRCIGPLSGHEVPTLKPGQTANPKGSSLKQRMRSALKKAFTEAALTGSVETLLKIAQDAGQGGAAVAASKLILDRTLGPVGPQGEVVVTVRTEIGFAPRTDGKPTPKPMRAPKTASDEPRVLRNPDAV